MGKDGQIDPIVKNHPLEDEVFPTSPNWQGIQQSVEGKFCRPAE
jgi:hypothetical protein